MLEKYGSAPRTLNHYSKNIHGCQLLFPILTFFTQINGILGVNLCYFLILSVDRIKKRVKILIKYSVSLEGL
jgi:hypothetical protein